MTAPRLLSIREAASMLGVPEQSLMRVAEQHGHLVRVGRAIRIVESELGELIDKCRSKPKTTASLSCVAEVAPLSGSTISASQSTERALAAARRLRSLKRNPSPENQKKR